MRWKYYSIGGSGNRPTLRFDDITITSTPAGPVAPIIITHPGSIGIPFNTGTTLNVVATGTEPLSYQWYQGNTGDPDIDDLIEEAESPNFTTPNLTATTSYWVRVTNSVDSADSSIATVTVNAFPFVQSTTPADEAVNVPVDSTITIQFSEEVDLSADAVIVMKGATPVTVTGLPASDTTSVVLTPEAPLEYGETYTVTVDKDEVTPNLETDYEFSFTTVAPAPPVFTLQPASQILGAGDPATLTVTVTGTPAPTLQWYAGQSGDTSTPLPDETDDELVITSVAATSYYWVRATNAADSADSQTAILSVSTPGPFGEGTVVVNRLGNGTTALSGIAMPVSLLEVETTGALKQIINMPTSGENQLTETGGSGLVGYIGSNGDMLAVPGFNLEAGSTLSDNKVVTLLGLSTNPVERALLPGTTLNGASNFRSVFPDGGGGVYLSGTGSAAANGGVWYYNGQDETFTRINAATTTTNLTNVRNVAIYGGQLFYSTGATGGPGSGIYKLGAGAPTSPVASESIELVFGVINPIAFYFVSTGAQGPGVLDRAWVASDNTAVNTGGLLRYDFNGTSWTETYVRRFSTTTNELTDATGATTSASVIRGLTGYWDAGTGTATLYATTADTTNNRLVKVVDDGTIPTTFTTLQSAGANYVFRGVTTAPVVTPPALVSTTPADAATEIAITSPITLNFNKPVNLTADAVAIEAPAGTPVAFSGLPTTGPVSSVVLTPNAPLPFATEVVVSITAAEVTDGDSLAMLADAEFSFTTLTPEPPAFDQPADQLIAESATATLQVTVTAGTPPLSYRWYRGAVGDTTSLVREELNTAATTDSYTTDPLTETTTYWLRVTNAAGQSTDSALITISTTGAPFVTSTTPADGAVAAPNDTIISIEFSEAVNLTAATFTFTDGVNPVPFAATPELPATGVTSVVLNPIAPLAFATTHKVTVVAAEVSDGTETMLADEEFEFTTGSAVQITVQPQPQSVFVGGTAEFEVTATGDGPLTYDWRLDGASLSAPSSPILTLTNLPSVSSGNISVVVTGPGVGNFEVSVDAALTVSIPVVTLTGASYTQDFNGIGSGLPLGWSVYTGASTSALGAAAAFTASAVQWSTSSAGFRNSASAIGLASDANAATQSSSANRALGVRQTGTFGDPGASFNFAFNSTGKVVTGISFEAQILDNQPRSTIWSVQAGIGLEPASWQTLGTFTDPNAFGSTPLTFSGAALASIANQPHVWIRIIALAPSSGGGNRDTFAVDDFALTFEDDTDPLYWDANGAIAGAGGPSPAGAWGVDAFWSADPDGLAAPGAWTPGGKAAFSAGADATGDYTVLLSSAQQAGSIFFEEGDEIILAGAPLILSGLPRLDVGSGVTYAATIASEIQGSAGLAKTGPGVLVLANTANTFTGLVSINAGALAIITDGSLGHADNDIHLGGLLGIGQDLVLNPNRAITGAGGIVFIEDAEALAINGSVNTSSFSVGAYLGDSGVTAFNGPSNILGSLEFLSPVPPPAPPVFTLQGQALTVNGITVSDTSADVFINNDLSIPLASANVTVASFSNLTLSGAITTAGMSGNNSLRKFGEGTLILTSANPGLHRVSLGGQGATPTYGGALRIYDKDAPGVSQLFLNYGTLEIPDPLTGANALPNGISISGRPGSPVVIVGNNLDIAGTSNIYGAADTSGSVVRLEVENYTIFTGSFIVDPGSIVPVDTLNLGSSGSVKFASPSFPLALILSDTVVVEFDSASIASGASAASGLLVESGATLHPGTDGAPRLVEVHHNFTLETGGTLVLDIAGAASGQFDALNLVTNGATHTVAGTVEVRFAPAYVPQAGHAFQLLGWQNDATADLTGVTLDLPALDAPLEWNTGLFESDGLIFISGPGTGAPIITAHPQLQDAFTGDTVFFTVTVIGEDLAYQWLFNGQPLPGAPDSPTLTLSNITAARAGLYSVIVTNSLGSVTSGEALLTVEGPPVIIVPPQSAAAAEGIEVVFTFTAAGSTLTDIQWQFNNGDLIGENGPTLTVIAGPGTYGNYRVRVENEYGFVFSVNATLSPPYDGPPTHAPEWDHSGPLPPGQIGLPYSFIPPVKPDDPVNEIYRSATSFTATGLPAGLKINAGTGEIFGIPAAIKATPYNVKITARNVAGSAVLTTSLLINPLPASALGVFTGPVQRSAILADVKPFNILGPQGGRFDMTVTAAGKVSGKITIGTKAHSFRSTVVIDPGEPDRAAVNAVIKRGKVLTDLVLALKVDTATGTIVDATVSDGAATTSFTGWRNPWSKNFRADVLAGYYTTKLELVDDALTSAEAPVGAGFLSFTVNPATGKLTLKGKLADGSAITMATFAGPAGQILLFRPLYAAAVKGTARNGTEKGGKRGL